MKPVRLLVFTFFQLIYFNAEAQYVDVDETVVAKDLNSKNILIDRLSFHYVNRILNTFLNVYNDSKKSRESVESARGKTEILKSNYEAFEVYPDSILSGWHRAVATDHQNFCEEVQVKVAKNKIVEFVIEECIRIGVSPIGSIKKAKATLKLNNFNGEQSELVNVYFIYDLEESTLIEAPRQPGYICIWTNKKGYLNEGIVMDNDLIEGATILYSEAPKCFVMGCVNMILKPGMYTFTARKKGNDHEGEFLIKSGKCLKYELP